MNINKYLIQHNKKIYFIKLTIQLFAWEKSEKLNLSMTILIILPKVG